MSEPRPFLELERVTVRRGGGPVLSEATLSIEPGASIALLGRSGSGKSTLLRVAAGLEAPASGRVLLDGREASRGGEILIPPHRRGIAMLFQDLALWPDLTVLWNVLLGLAGSGLSRRDRLARAREALEACSVLPLAERKPAQLSGGEAQRAALARALAVRPWLLLLDEPFSGLDLVTKDEVLARIAAASRQDGIALVLVSHDPLEVSALCRQAAVLEDGRLVEHGTLADLVREPRSAILRAFRDRLGPAEGRT
ncbi:MAG: ATP-binding cassette domain-containing protein [Planctomycetes bacterium]|nr:ATP-binding cassette domain-containing protein [Planctomycetota bacterium]